jgi:hypothetical protein
MNTNLLRNVLLPVVVLTAIYGLAIWGLISLFRAVGLPKKRCTFAGFLAFGLASGLLAAWAWPLDSSVYWNVYGIWLGDAVYGLAVEHLGDPWFLRVPQVYVVASTILYAILGLLAQLAHTHTTSEGA